MSSVAALRGASRSDEPRSGSKLAIRLSSPAVPRGPAHCAPPARSIRSRRRRLASRPRNSSRSRSVAVGLAAILGAASSSATAAPERLAVVPSVIAGPHGEAGIEALFDAALRAAALRPSLEPGSFDELFLFGADPPASTARACGSDTGCAARVLADAGYALGLGCILNFAVDPPLLTLSLLEISGARIAAEELFEVPSDRTPELLLERAASELLDRAGHRRGGRIRITVEPPDAHLAVPSALVPERGRRLTFLAPPGVHTLSAQRAGREEATAVVEVTSGGEHLVALALPQAPEPASTGLGPWPWIAAGAAVAAGVAASVVLLSGGASGGAPRCVCITSPGVPCPPCP